MLTGLGKRVLWLENKKMEDKKTKKGKCLRNMSLDSLMLGAVAIPTYSMASMALDECTFYEAIRDPFVYLASAASAAAFFMGQGAIELAKRYKIVRRE